MNSLANPIAHALTFATLGVLGLRFHALAPPGFYFGVRVAPSFPESDDGLAIARTYRSCVATYLGAGVVAMIWSIMFSPAIIALPMALVVVGIFHGYAVANRRVRPFAVLSNGTLAAVLAPRRSVVSFAVWQIPAWAILAGTAAWLVHERTSPSRISGVHAGPDGAADGGMSIMQGEVFLPLLPAAAVLGMLLVVGWLLTAHTRKGNAPNWSMTRVALILVGLAVSITSSASVLASSWGPTPLVVSTLTSALVLLSILVLAQKRNKKVNVGDGSPDSSWTWGVFYCNPEDPALQVPKRVGIGYTLNYARPGAWVISTVLSLVSCVAGVAAMGPRWTGIDEGSSATPEAESPVHVLRFSDPGAWGVCLVLCMLGIAITIVPLIATHASRKRGSGRGEMLHS